MENKSKISRIEAGYMSNEQAISILMNKVNELIELLDRELLFVSNSGEDSRLSKTSKKVMDAYNALVSIGKKPTYHRIAGIVGIGSRAGVYYHIKKLKQLKLLEEENGQTKKT